MRRMTSTFSTQTRKEPKKPLKTQKASEKVMKALTTEEITKQVSIHPKMLPIPKRVRGRPKGPVIPKKGIRAGLKESLFAPKRKGTFKEGHVGHTPVEELANRPGGLVGSPKKKAVDLAAVARDILSARSISMNIQIGDETMEMNLKSPKTMYGAVLSVLLAKAIKGNVVAAKEVIDRGLGKAVQAVEEPKKVVDDSKPEELDYNELEQIVKYGKSG